METNDTEVINSTNDTEKTENTEETQEQGEETITIPKKKWDEVQAQKDHWKDKATKKVEIKPEVKEEVKIDSSLSQADVIYIAKADIHEDDIAEVIELAKLKRISVKEAHAYMTPILNERQEERKTAQATQSKGGARGTAKLTADTIIAEASKGKLPEKDSDIESLAQARMAKKLERLNR